MKRIATLAASIALIAPGSAAAQGSSSTCQAYNPQLCSVTSTSSSGSSGSGSLPFTGLDAILLGAGGGTLAASGFVVRRLTRRLN